MTDVIGSLTTELRIAGRIFRETLMGIRRTGWMNWIIVVTMASILSIFGTVLAVIIEMSTFIHTVGSELEISAYLKDGVNAQTVKDELLKLAHLKKITLIPKEKAWADMQSEYPLPEIENPLPDTIHLQMASEKHIPDTVQKIRQMPGIETVQYPKKVLDKIQGMTQAASIAGIFISVFLGTLTLFIISNTIHLLIQAKSREIEILRMMGVGNWYIRLPFLMQGASYGLAGAVLSYSVVSLTVYYITQLFRYFGFQTNELTLSFVMTLLILMGILVGSGGAMFAVKRHLQT